MERLRSNLVLIGMPGAGKSTVGVLLAKQTARDFIDTDVLIQTIERRSLQAIVDRDGYLALRRIEEAALLGLQLRDHVIATGGSAAYSDTAMRHLARDGIVCYLRVALPVLRARVGDYATRGLAKRPDQSLEDLFHERGRLYARYADVTVDCDDLTHEQVCARIAAVTAP